MQAEHRISSLKLVIDTTDQVSALAARRQLTESWQNELGPVLESAFDKLPNNDHYLHIDRVELKIKVDSLSELAGAVSDELFDALQQKLVSLPEHSALVNTSVNAQGEPLLLSQTPFSQTLSLETLTQEQQYAKQWAPGELIQHYLEYGHKPWFVDLLEFENIIGAQLAERQSDLVRLAESKDDINVWYRLIDLLLINSETYVVDLMQKMFSSEASFNTLIEKLIQPLTAPNLSVSSLAGYDRIWLIISLISIKRPSLISQLNATPNMLPPVHAWKAILDECALSEVERSEVAPELLQTISEMFSEPLNKHVDNATPAGETAVSSAVDLPDASISSDVIEIKTDVTTLRDSEAEESISELVDYAGLVIVTPFLQKFFNNRGLEIEQAKQQSQHFASTDLAYAATLLHAIATGERECREYQLDFIRLLLGIEKNTVIPTADLVLGDEDLSSVDDLVSAIIGHWTALGSVSINGLRESFISRNAMLSDNEKSWQLHFERMGHDVLLDRLPWSMQTVKLPWMSKPINVNW